MGLGSVDAGTEDGRASGDIGVGIESDRAELDFDELTALSVWERWVQGVLVMA